MTYEADPNYELAKHAIENLGRIRSKGQRIGYLLGLLSSVEKRVLEAAARSPARETQNDG